MKEQALKGLKESALVCPFCSGLIHDTQENLEARRERHAHGQSWARVREEQRGSPCLPLLLCAWCCASRPFTRSSFCAFSCFTSQWLLELSAPVGTWGGKDFPASAPGLFASSPPHMAICKMHLLTSLLIFVLSLNSGVYWVALSLNLRPEGLIRSPCLIGFSVGQRVSIHSCMAEQGKEMPLKWAAVGYI